MQLRITSDKSQNGNVLYQYLAAITGCLTVLSTGMHFSWPSQSLPQLLSEDSLIPITSDDGSWLATMPCIGSVVGCLTAIYLVDKIGRKLCLLITAPLYFFAWILVAYAQSVLFLNLARFLAGIADGLAFTALPVYLSEIADPKIRGLLSAFLTITTMFGYLLINLIGSYFNIYWTALISSTVPVLHLVSFCLMPESPYFLIMLNRSDKAKTSLQTLKGMENVDVELERLQNAVKTDLDNSAKIWDLFTKENNRKSVIIVAGLRGIQQFAGTNVITFYAKTIFQESGDYIPPSLGSIIYFSIQLVVSMVSSILVDRIGRKPLLIFSIIGSGFALALEGLYFYFDSSALQPNSSGWKYVPIIALLLYVIIFNIGMGTIPLLMAGELFPTSVKGFALGLADIYFGVVVTIVAKLFQIIKDSCGLYVPFMAFSGFCAIGLVFIVVFVPETKGKTLEEIQAQLKGEVPKNVVDR